MSNILAVDIGNSRVKWAIIDAAKISSHGVFSYNARDFEKNLIETRMPVQVSSVQVSCVAGAGITTRFAQWLAQNDYPKSHFAQTQAEQNGVLNAYDKPANMGVDRWLAMLAAKQLSSTGQHGVVCVIDCGTAITLDVLSAKGKHAGGFIMPGYQTMLQSLVAGTGNLDVLGQPTGQSLPDAGLASSTQSAITTGCSQLMIEGLAGMVTRYIESNAVNLHCFISGGDGDWVAQALSKLLSENKLFSSEYAPFLVLQGLYFSSKK